MFGNPLVLKENCDLSNIQTVVVGYENHELLQDRMGQFLMGTYESAGRLPFTVNATFGRGKGEKVKSAGRLKDSQPEELGISRQKLQKIDDIVERSIAAGAFPGCQIVVAFEGSIVYRKSFGNHTYDTTTMPVQNTDIYDIVDSIFYKNIKLQITEFLDKKSYSTSLKIWTLDDIYRDLTTN